MRLPARSFTSITWKQNKKKRHTKLVGSRMTFGSICEVSHYFIASICTRTIIGFSSYLLSLYVRSMHKPHSTGSINEISHPFLQLSLSVSLSIFHFSSVIFFYRAIAVKPECIHCTSIPSVCSVACESCIDHWILSNVSVEWNGDWNTNWYNRFIWDRESIYHTDESRRPVKQEVAFTFVGRFETHREYWLAGIEQEIGR